METLDITSFFFCACKHGLSTGELAHSKGFELQFVMSAAEIMDPKMDPRMKGQREIIGIHETLARGQLFLKEFNDKHEVLGIMDELLAAFVNWLTGSSLAQTVFTSMYMHCTHLVEDFFLSTFCETLRRSIYYLREFILGASIFEEFEDFSPSFQGLPLEGPDTLLTTIGDSHKGIEFVESLNTDSIIEQLVQLELYIDQHLDISSIYTAFKSRVQMLFHFLSFSRHLPRFLISWPDEDQDMANLGYDLAHFPDEIIRFSDKFKDVSDYNATIASCRIHLEKLLHLTKLLWKTALDGKQAGEGKRFPKDYDYGLPGFEPYLNQNNLSNVVIYDRPGAFAFLHGMFARVLNVFQQIERYSNDPLSTTSLQVQKPYPCLHNLWALIQHFGQIPCHSVELLNDISECELECLPLAGSCVFSRSILFSLYLLPIRWDMEKRKNDLHLSYRTELFLYSWLLSVPSSLRNYIRKLILSTEGLSVFFECLSLEIFKLPRLYSLNRSRQRCEVENLLVSLPNLLYDCIQIEAELIEALGTNSVTKKQSSHCNKPPTATKDDNYISSSNVNCSRLSGPNSNSIQSSLKVEADGRPDDTLDSCIRSNRLAQKRIAHVPSSRRHKAGARRSARHKVGPTQPHDSGCCPNADSRGQSKLASFIQQDMATSDVSTANSRIKEELLDLENITCGGDRLPKPPTQGLYLRLSSYISYFYLHLAWDYLVSGFQLDLYAPHEWTYMYAFLEQILHKLLFPLCQLADSSQPVQSPSPLEAPKITSADQNGVLISESKETCKYSRPPMQNLNRKINEKSLNNEAVSSSSLESSKDLFTQSVEKGIEGADQKEPSSLPPFIPETFDITPIWKSELLLTFAHIFLIRGSLCVLRALQRDSHLPVNPAYAARNQPDYQTVRDSLVELVNLADPVEEYTRRLGVLVNQPYSPLVELDFDSEANYGGTRSGGSAALFARSHAYLTGPQFTEEPTEQLYANAAHLFETAHLRLLQADQHDQLQQEHLISWEASTTQPWAGRLGPPDSPILLKSLAKHNAIACRILAARPDRRPRPMERMTLATEGVVFASKEQPSEVSPLPEDNGASSSYNASTRTSLSLNTCIPKSSEPAVSCKRPLIHYYPTHHSQQQHHLGLRCRPYLPPNCPVEMVFTFLPSRMYPLIRLLTTCSESKT